MFSYIKKNFKLFFALLAVVIILWTVLGPVQLGGPVSYVIISGNSMEPDVLLGDLVVARSAPEYSLGQAVIYRHPQIGFVFHRIIDAKGGTFSMQGDNNDWVDSYQPSESEILGKYWFKITGGGTAIRKLREPAFFSIFTFIIILLFASLFLAKNGDAVRRKLRRNAIMINDKKLTSGDTRQELLLFIGVLALIAIIFGVVSFTRPTTQLVNDDLIYYQQGDFSYTAKDAGNLYDSDKVSTGEPVYLQLTCDVDLNIGYQLLAPDLGMLSPEEFSGSYRVDAVLSDVDGWKRSFNLIPTTEFEGTSFNAEMTFDFCDARNLIIAKEEKTETKNRWYDFVILPRVFVTGTLESFPLEDSFQPSIAFQMDGFMLRMADGLEGMDLSQEGLIANQRVVFNTMHIFGQEISVILSRKISLITLLFCLLAAVLPAWSLLKDWRASTVSRIQVQYHPLLVDIQEGHPALHADQVVDVASFADLTKMAERYGAMILHESSGTFHRYSVQDENTVYQYELDVWADDSLFPDRYSFKRALLQGINQDHFDLIYQPIVELHGRQVVEVEAFLRWNHPNHGTIYPVDFIPQAEQMNLVPELDRWVIKKVCQQINEWRDANVRVVPVSVNISPKTILREDFVGTISGILSETLCQPELIQIEVNRSNQAFKDKHFADRLVELTDLGVSLVIDDFATDDANQINQVLQAPIKSMKIDKSVVLAMKDDPQARSLVGAVVAMAKRFQVKVIAQGVESVQDLELIQAEGLEIAQGFFLGKPAPADQLIEKLGVDGKANLSEGQEHQ